MRNAKAMSLIEMLSALFITSFIGMIIAEIAVTQNVVAFKTANKLDSLIAARRMFPIMERDIHNCRVVKSLSADTLVLSVPEFNSSGEQIGFPILNGASWTSDTITYSLVQSSPNEFSLQRALNSGASQVLASNIVGPLDPANPATPMIFSSPGLNQIRVTMEIAPIGSSRKDLNVRSIAVASDFCTRSNIYAP